ncbi:MAG TPA: L-glutamate gamma-semialdehyde dehydrogenase [Gallionellaceae bacterium]|nr:L-glutamate gamma-semialdehyde dehydrogenase [Gallionellaceae bacterium]
MESLEDDIRAKGGEIIRLMASGAPPVFDRRRWTGMLMNLAMADTDLKVRLFRFVDVLPALATSEQLIAHIREYFLAEEAHLPPLLKRLLGGLQSGTAASVAAAMLKGNIVSFSRGFIAGQSPRDALPTLRKHWREGYAATVDILGEAVLSEDEATSCFQGYLDLIRTLAAEMPGWPVAPDAAREEHFPRLNVSVKLTSLFSRIGTVNYDESMAMLKDRLRPIFRAARDAGGCVNLDMETYALKPLTLDLFVALLEEEEFRDWQGAGIALQAYLKDTHDDLQRLIEWARASGRRIMVRLVKGAYWEYETVNARQKGWPLPVFERKAHTDWNYERCADLMLANSDVIAPALGSHNARTLAAAMVAAERRGIARETFEFQMLFGMADPVKFAVRELGYGVREYVPTGALIPGMAYLVRRLLENTSDEGFLRKVYVEGEELELLLAPPEPWPGEDEATVKLGPGEYANEPPLDFSQREVRDACQAALEKVRGQLGRQYPALVDGKEIQGAGSITSVNPARPDEVVGHVASITQDDAAQALAAARRAQPAWAAQSPDERATVLFRAAEIARARRLELMAWQVFETGKNRAEADADVAEAIDYFEYYAREMRRLGAPFKVGNVPGENNRYFYQPRGVALVIAPWNFPLAISAGMTAAALVAGNAVLYKPSSLSAVTGWQLVSILREAGVPEGVLNFIPGPGAAVGGWLAAQPGVDMIAFTGSREVGLGLVESAGRAAGNRRSVKRVIAEMGGKNAVIVDADADLDQAVAGVLQSAFGFQGQKCSACSRVIVHDACYDRFLARLCQAVHGIQVGPPDDPANFMGPLIDGAAREKVERYIALAEREGRIVVRGHAPEQGWYAPPVVVADLPPDSAILREEIFGPVLAVIRAASMDAALAIANDSDYALTGGLYSRSPANIRLAMRGFAAGNLYINRAITGAVVGRQPFGGFKMSGVGSKAGGPDYLLQFMEPRVVTENTLRRGFAPDVLS